MAKLTRSFSAAILLHLFRLVSENVVQNDSGRRLRCPSVEGTRTLLCPFCWDIVIIRRLRIRELRRLWSSHCVLGTQLTAYDEPYHLIFTSPWNRCRYRSPFCTIENWSSESLRNLLRVTWLWNMRIELWTTWLDRRFTAFDHCYTISWVYLLFLEDGSWCGSPQYSEITWIILKK